MQASAHVANGVHGDLAKVAPVCHKQLEHHTGDPSKFSPDRVFASISDYLSDHPAS